MKVTVIGYWGAYPQVERATSSYLLECDGFTCLLDCGSGVLSRLQKYKSISDLDAIVLSHYHHDHIADVGSLQYAFLIDNLLHQRNRTWPIYGHHENEERFQSLFHTATEGKAYKAGDVMTIGPFQFQFLKTVHPVPCYAMKITDGKSTIVYTADTSFFEDLIPFCQNADLLIAESSFYKGMDSTSAGHMTSDECGKIANRASVRELWLTHLPHFGNVSELKREASEEYDGKIYLADEGLSWEA
ncbi:MBL fold metallo-hydrolase [Salirhabdus salicampi]|uniref:MBL fold metallo-hydrolase n=1 Tax=Salirhabdus salicampi TaxID=476102 RepID=UPI0020C4D55F|nr:MBL fold metallo-hydrolase [Salirhabdus salicampi]MCP8615526.1 MBL fold metallo-hydrolase [Salirhabdus salicampi]